MFRNQRSPSSVASEMSTSLSMRSSGHVGYRWFYQPANTVTWEDQGDPLALVSKQLGVGDGGRQSEQAQVETAFAVMLQG